MLRPTIVLPAPASIYYAYDNLIMGKFASSQYFTALETNTSRLMSDLASTVVDGEVLNRHS